MIFCHTPAELSGFYKIVRELLQLSTPAGTDTPLSKRTPSPARRDFCALNGLFLPKFRIDSGQEDVKSNTLNP